MSLVFHLSDLHFGPKHLPHLADLVLDDIRELQPALVILSGDFTMRGRLSEYEQARAYIKRISAPVFTIPGNHDQPLQLSAVFERLTHPMKRYQRFIHPNVDSVYANGDLFVAGVNDNRPILPGGFWSRAQRIWLANELAHAPHNACKIVVTHHQVIWHKPRPAGVWNAQEKLAWLAQEDVELVLNGHTHVPLAQQPENAPIVVQAGTAMCSRIRHGHGNTYNLIEIKPDVINITVRRFDENRDHFQSQDTLTFQRKRSAHD